MVRGLDLFKEYFAAFTNNYLIIGGTARDIIIKDAGFEPKGTKDIDMILVHRENPRSLNVVRVALRVCL